MKVDGGFEFTDDNHAPIPPRSNTSITRTSIRAAVHQIASIEP